MQKQIFKYNFANRHKPRTQQEIVIDKLVNRFLQYYNLIYDDRAISTVVNIYLSHYYYNKPIVDNLDTTVHFASYLYDNLDNSDIIDTFI